MRTVKIEGETYIIEIWQAHTDRPQPDRIPTRAEIQLLVQSMNRVGELASPDPDHSSFHYHSGTFYSAFGGRYFLLGSGGANTIFSKPAQPDGRAGSSKMIIFSDLATMRDCCRTNDPHGIRTEFENGELAAKIYPQHHAIA